jgi:hypothetical protein
MKLFDVKVLNEDTVAANIATTVSPIGSQVIKRGNRKKKTFFEASSRFLKEATNINVKIINEIIDQIFYMLPKELELSELTKTFTIHGSRLDLEKLSEQFPKFNDFFDHIKNVRFQFLNSPRFEDHPTKGLYNPDENLIVVNVSGILGYFAHPKSALTDRKGTFSVYAVMFHEIRHVMQHKDYPDFFTSKKDRDKDYKKRDIEIDAMWYNIIAVYNPSKFRPKAFAHRVIEDLLHYRELTDKQKDHYYKKTLKYYSNPEYFKVPENTKEYKIRNTVPKKIYSYLSSDEYDLRKLDGYNKDNFLFPVKNVIGGIRKAIAFGETETNFVKNMLFFVPSLMMPKSLAKVWKAYMTMVHQYSLEEALENFETGMPPDHFDYESMKKHMKEFYS